MNHQEQFGIASMKRALSAPASGHGLPYTTEPASEATAATDVDGFLAEMVDADHVDIVGVLPWYCAARLIEITDERAQSGSATIGAESVFYFTPARERSTVFKHSGVLGTVVQRWLAGMTGVRNWLAPFGPAQRPGTSLSIFEFDDVYFDCTIRVVKNGISEVATLSQLPIVRSMQTAGSPGSPVILGRMDAGRAREFAGFVEALARESREFVPLQIRCVPPQSGRLRREGDEFEPIIARIDPYGKAKPGDLEPVVVVAACASTPKGDSVLLQERSKQNARDDFGTLSLISERVLAEDLASAMGSTERRELAATVDAVWMSAGKPDTLLLSEDAFRYAAQRELFHTCGIDIDISRLDFRGRCMVEREGEGSYIGFYVYRLDLRRSLDHDDEVHIAHAWSSDLRTVPLKELYTSPIRDRLNRLLRTRSRWLQEGVFNGSRS